MATMRLGKGEKCPACGVPQPDRVNIRCGACGVGFDDSLIKEIPNRALAYGECCPYCGAKQEYEANKHCHKCRREFFTSEPPPPPPPGTMQYRVLTQRDEWFGGNFSPERLEDAINAFAAEGWRAVSMATADVGSWLPSFKPGGPRQEIVVLLERIVK